MSNGNAAPLVRHMPYGPPPMAALSLNAAPDILIRHAQDLERFAATESCLSETGGRERFWRAAAALRAVAIMASDDPARFAVICERIELQRRARS